MPGRRSLDAHEGIGRNTVYSFAVQLATSAFTAALTLFLVRALEPSGYGLFTLALAVAGIVAVPADLGITHSAARFLAEARSSSSRAARVLADALVLKAVASGLTAAALFAAAGPVAAGYGEPDLLWPLRGVAVALFGHSVMTMVRGSFVALARISVNLRLVVSESAVETAASVGLVLLGTGAAGAAFGRAIGYLFGAALGVALLAAVLGRGIFDARGFRWERARPIARYAGALAVVDGAFVLFGHIDALVIGGLLGATAVGVYKAPMRFIVFLHYPGLAVANAVAPRLARTGDEAPNVAAFVAAMRFLIVFQALVIAPIVVWSRPLVDLLLGPGYEEAADVLRALAPYVFLSGLAPLVSLTANYLGEARRRIPIALATLAVDVALCVVLVPEMGIVGAAWATNVAFAVYVPGHLWICRRLVAVPLRPIVLTTVRSGLAAAAAGAFLAVLGTDSLEPWEWVAGAIGGTLVFGTVLVLVGEVGARDRQALRRAVGRLRP